MSMLDRLDSDSEFDKRIYLSDELTFHVSGMLNKHSSRIKVTENPDETGELEQDTSRINMWCGVTRDRIIGPFSSLKNLSRFISTF